MDSAHPEQAQLTGAQLRVLSRVIALLNEDWDSAKDLLDELAQIIREELGYDHFAIGLVIGVINVESEHLNAFGDGATLVGWSGGRIVGWSRDYVTM